MPLSNPDSGAACGGKFLSNGTGIFLGTENRNGIELYHLRNTGKVFAFSGHEASDYIQPNKWYRKISIVSVKKGEKGNDSKAGALMDSCSKGITFFRKISTGMNRSYKW